MEEVARGHLRRMLAPAPPIYTYRSAVPLIRHFWIPVWDIPDGAVWPQRTLQHPYSLVVIADSYARFYGVASGLSGVELEGRGWAFGTTFEPSAGIQLAGGSMAAHTDRATELTSLATLDGAALTGGVRAAMAADPHAEASHQAGIALLEHAFAAILAGDEEGALVDRICDWVATDPQVLRVTQVCERFDVTERTLQRVLVRRIGLTPKWLIQRRRLQDAALSLRELSDQGLADLAADLGYADQAHFTRDFARVVGMTPKQFRDAPG